MQIALINECSVLVKDTDCNNQESTGIVLPSTDFCLQHSISSSYSVICHLRSWKKRVK